MKQRIGRAVAIVKSFVDKGAECWIMLLRYMTKNVYVGATNTQNGKRRDSLAAQ